MTNSKKSDKSQTFSVDLTPHPSVYMKVGKSGHNLDEIFGEFGDNSADAITEEQLEGKETLIIRITINAKKNSIVFEDNASGMNQQQITDCLVLAKTEKNKGTTIGENGIGTKAAALSLADTFKIISGVKGETKLYTITYDNQKVLAEGFLQDEAGKIDEKDVDYHGTKIIIDNVTKVTRLSVKTTALISNLSKRYAYFLRKGNVEIYVNNEQVQPPAPIKWLPGYPVDIDIPTKYGVIEVRNTGLMETGSFKYSGFDLFKKVRMIKEHSNFGIDDQSRHHINRVYGEVHLNFIGVTHEKNNFIVTSKEYEEAETVFKNSEFLKELKSQAKKTHETNKDQKEEQEIREKLKTPMAVLSSKANDLFEAEAPKKEKLAKDDDGVVPPNKATSLFDLFRKERKPEEKPRKPYEKHDNEPDVEKKFKIKHGRNFEIELIFDSIPEEGRRVYYFSEEQKKLTITINKDFAAYKKSKDRNFYVLESAADAVTQFICTKQGIGENILTKYNDTKDKLLSDTINDAEYFEAYQDAEEDGREHFDEPQEELAVVSQDEQKFDKIDVDL